jgi:sortase A
VPPTGADLLTFSYEAARTFFGVADEPAPALGISNNGDFRLEIPTVALDTAVLARGWHTVAQLDGSMRSVWDNIDFAAGWHKNSATPGERGNVVISGHSNTGGAVFRDLWQLEPGSKIYVTHNRVRYGYVIEQVTVEQETFASEAQRNENAAYLQQTDDQRLTLITCWPWYSDTHRVFVVAKLTSMTPVTNFVK